MTTIDDDDGEFIVFFGSSMVLATLLLWLWDLIVKIIEMKI